MKQKIKNISCIFYACIMLVFILDSRAVIAGAKDGVQLCIKTVIPCLLPFIVISSLITSSNLENISIIPKLIKRLCKIPDGAEVILLMGLLGGYPIGAACIHEQWKNGQLEKHSAQRMLGFCNNAGPAFIFGMTSVIFESNTIPWIIWFIHLLSAIIVGAILPGSSNVMKNRIQQKTLTPLKTIEKSITIMAKICLWVTLFRLIITVLNRWIFFATPIAINVILSGILELSNGYLILPQIPMLGLRFILSACFISFGGLSVALQTISVTDKLGCGLYFQGKMLQTAITFLLAAIFQYFLFPAGECFYIPLYILPLILSIVIIYGKFLIKNSSNRRLCVV